MTECPIDIKVRCTDKHVHSYAYVDWLKMLVADKVKGIEIVLLPEELSDV